MTKSLRCVSWSAVSTERQAEEISLDIQRETNAENAASIDGVIVAELTVPGHSREYDTIAEIAEDVPAYAELLRMIQDQSFDVLLAYRPDRLARTPSLLLEIARKCWRNHIALYIDSMPPHSLDPRKQQDSMAQVLLMAFAGVQAGEEMNVLRQRHRWGMPKRIRDGDMPGRPPYGYLYQNGSIAIDEKAAPVVRRILIDFIADNQLSYPQIMRILNREGHTAPTTRQAQLLGKEPQYSGRWTYTGVRSIAMRAAVYAGYIEYNKESATGREYMIERGKHEPIITEDELARVEKAVKAKRRGPWRTYALSGVCVCGVCGERMVGHTANHRDGSFMRSYIYCRPCGWMQPEQRVLDELANVVAHIEENTEATEDSRYDREMAALHRRLGQIDETIAERNAAIHNLVVALEDATLPLDIISQQLRERKSQVKALESERIGIEQQVHEILSRPSQREVVEEIQRAGSRMVASALDEPDAFRRWASGVFDAVVLRPSGEVDVYVGG